MVDNKITVAGYITQQLSISPKTQVEVTEELGLDKPNIVTMFKQGRTKVPINRIPALANALGVDPVYLLSLAMNEYMPDAWQVIQKLLKNTLITDNELAIVNIIREGSAGMNLRPETAVEKEKLKILVSEWQERERKDIEALKNLKEL